MLRILPILALLALSANAEVLNRRQLPNDNPGLPTDSPVIDPCTALLNRTLVPHRDMLACFDSFPPLPVEMRNQILDTTESFLNLYPYYDIVRKSPDPKFPSSIDIKARLNQIRTKQYTTDRAFHEDISKIFMEFKDGHTSYSHCYRGVVWTQPWSIIVKYPNAAAGNTDNTKKPVVEIKSLAQRQYVETTFRGLEARFEASYRTDFGINPDNYIGAEILEIDGVPIIEAATALALSAQTSGVKDDNARFNSVFSKQVFHPGKGLIFTDSGLSVSNTFPETSSRRYKLQFKNGTIVDLTVPWLATGFFNPRVTRDFIWENICIREEIPAGIFPPGSFPQVAGLRSSVKALSTVAPTKKKESLTVISPELFSPVIHHTFDISTIRSLKKRSKKTSSIVRREFRLDGVEFIGGDNYTAFYNLPDGVTSVWLFPTVSILDNDGVEKNIQTVFENIAKIQRQKRKLLIDVSNNGGGLIALGYIYMKLLFDDIKLPVFSMRSTEMLSGLAKAYLIPSIAQEQPTGFFRISKKTAIPGEPAFVADSWSYPTKTNPDNVEGAYTSKYIDLVRYVDETIIDTTLAEYKLKQDYWNANTMLILSDGNCGSMCSWMTRAFSEYKGIKTYVYGGRSDVASGNTFPYAGFEGAPAISSEYQIRKEILSLIPALPNVTRDDFVAGITPGSEKSWIHLAIADSLTSLPVRVNWTFPISNTFTTEKSNKIAEWTYTPADYHINVENPFENRTGLWLTMASKFGVGVTNPGGKSSNGNRMFSATGSLGSLISIILVTLTLQIAF